jgi:hypothetical protein
MPRRRLAHPMVFLAMLLPTDERDRRRGAGNNDNRRESQKVIEHRIVHNDIAPSRFNYRYYSKLGSFIAHPACGIFSQKKERGHKAAFLTKLSSNSTSILI